MSFNKPFIDDPNQDSAPLSFVKKRKFNFKSKRQQEGFNLTQQKRSIYKRLYTIVWLYTEEYIKVLNIENKTLTRDNRQKLFDLILSLPEIIEIQKKNILDMEHAIEAVFCSLAMHGDITSARVKQIEILREHDEIVTGAIEAKQFDAANKANIVRMQLYKLIPDKTVGNTTNSFVQIKQNSDGSKEALASGTPEEVISIVRQAMLPKPKLLQTNELQQEEIIIEQ